MNGWSRCFHFEIRNVQGRLVDPEKVITEVDESMKPLYILVLAAGQGTRMKSELPKVLHPVGGRPLLEHVLKTAEALRSRELAVVLGVGRERVQAELTQPETGRSFITWFRKSRKEAVMRS